MSFCFLVMRSSYRGTTAEPAKLLAFSEKDRKHLESNRALLNPPKDFDLTESHVCSCLSTSNLFNSLFILGFIPTTYR